MGEKSRAFNVYVILSEQQRIHKIVTKNVKLCLLYSVFLIEES